VRSFKQHNIVLYSIALTAILATAGSTSAHAQDWKQKRDEDGIKVSTATTEGSNVKAIKVECNIDARPAQLVAFLMDVNRQGYWVYGNKKAELLKRPAPNEMIFYAEVNVPWPCTNRDYISHIVVQQKSPTLIVIDAKSEPDDLPKKDGLVRVQKSLAHWELTSVGKDQVHVNYFVQFDPGGSVPAWLTNLFLTKGPFETFEKLRKGVKEPEFQNAHLPYIKEM
jgi:hypothetical protein